ncbi:hypothetical protein ILUMI_13439 [Ignelater luminosus]|uniref:EF-hand domain-containing protein n=1 Tax=Ignelater luminosus TaxID=2038154 RepID=A0A8K0CSA7_IGNLU|nr:hypothetical protein ILUMI_13439 [Ignelater luminosus]
MVNRTKRGSAGKTATFTEELKRRTAKASRDHLDESLDTMEETRFKRKYVDLIHKLSKELHFTREELESLVVIYYKLLRANNTDRKEITKNEVKDILHDTFDITDTKMAGYIICKLDKRPGPNFSMENWLRSMSLYLRGTFDEQIKFCFEVYDIMSKGVLDPRMLMHLMSGSLLGEHDDMEVLKDLVECVTKKMDLDRDGVISLEDFRQVIVEEPLLLECFGQCLPTRLASKAFLISFTPYIGKL